MSCCKALQVILGGDNLHYENNKASASEKGKTFALQVVNGIGSCRVKLDNGILPIIAGRKQCDYLFVLCSNRKQFFFVELKGSGVNADIGYEQLCQAISRISKSIEIIDKNQITGIIVGGADTQNMNRLKERFRRDIGKILIHKTRNRYEHSC